MQRTLLPLCTLMLLLALTAAGSAAEKKELAIPISDARAVFAIYTHGGGLTDTADNLIFAAWEDGHVVWSENQVAGGSPYRTGTIDPTRFKAALTKLQQDGFFRGQDLARPHVGPDARSTVIQAAFLLGQVKMESWHELYEAEGKVVATANGLVPLAHQTRNEVLFAEPHDYLFYRFAWDEFRLAAARLIPTDHKPVSGRIELKNGKAIWHESMTGS